jgi:tRNA (guanine-N7-)-methyltransferase
VGKDKLKRFRELESIERVIQPTFEEIYQKDYRLKGRWKQEVFGNDQPLVIELGCGKGEYTVGMARRYPEKNFLGVDIKGARIWKGAVQARDEDLDNVAFLRTRIEFINSFFAAGEADELWITFPDPQEKKRRRKKRLTGAPFLNSYRQFLVDGGRVNLKTDNRNLFLFTRDLVEHNGLSIERQSEDLYNSGWEDETVSIRTYYEQRFLEEGLPIHFIQFRLPSGITVEDLPDDSA